MKKIIVLLLSLLLCACSSNKDLNSQLEDAFALKQDKTIRPNNYAKYVEYYLPGDVNEVDYSDASFCFDINGNKFLMNINISNIISNEHYNANALVDEGFFDKEKLICEKSGAFENINDIEVNYFVKVYNYDEKCLIYFVTDDVIFYGLCEYENVELLVGKMLQMAYGLNVEKEGIITNYSSKDIIDYEKNVVDLFENIFPVSGRIDDLMVDSKSEVSE